MATPDVSQTLKTLGITEHEAIGRLERSGTNEVFGLVLSENGEIYYDVFTERSDVSVTTFAVGEASAKSALKDPEEVCGYKIFIVSAARGIFLETKDRRIASHLHDLAVSETRLGGPSHATQRLLTTAKSLGVMTHTCALNGR